MVNDLIGLAFTGLVAMALVLLVPRYATEYGALGLACDAVGTVHVADDQHA